MKRNLSLLLLFIGFSVFAQQQVKVMTYNIRNSRAADGVNKWDKRKETLANLILKVNPDVLGTQEVRFDQLKDLKQFLSAYKAYGAGRSNGKHSGEHSTVFYKIEKFELLKGGNFWLSETPNIPGSKSWDAAITRICSWVKLKDRQSGKEFFIFNTHFDHKGKQARRNSAQLIRQTIDSLAGDLPVVVMGDFNFTPSDPGYATMTDNSNHKVSLKDAFSKEGLDYTNCGFEVSNNKCSRIDYIFHSKHFTDSKYAVLTDNNGTYYPSDHLAVSSVLRWVDN